ncbi:MAG TPA: hypothetical protein VEW74_04065, partial [Candidatus Nitrosotalea sp.]|nr:hypothetical protein [Candidatus Nitrosotalea sp.]
MRLFSRLLFFTTGACAIAVAACNGPTSSLAPAGTPARSSGVKPMTTSSPTPIPFVFQTVDDPNSTKNQVTGINQLSKIVGVYGAGQGSTMPQSYTALPPYSQFHGMNYPGA